nr:hypothetical protein [Tanacetum cinerariifolium]
DGASGGLEGACTPSPNCGGRTYEKVVPRNNLRDQSLVKGGAYDLGVKGDLVSAVTDFENVSFGLLDELKSLKDSPLASIMSALVLKDAQGNVVYVPELQRFQPSFDQVTVPIYSESSFISGDVLLSEVVPTARAAAKKRSCVRVCDGGPVTQPPVMQAHEDLLDTSVLDGTGDA